MSMKVHILDWFRDLYHQFPDQKVVGMYVIHQPTLVVNDPDMARQILVKDFNHFVDRDTEENMTKAFPGKTDAYWLEQMTIMTGDKWKDIRSTFSPIFTSGKMKAMMRFIDKVSDSLVQHMDKNTALSDGFELKESFGKFSLDTLASCAFGVDGQSFTNDKSVFVKHAAELFNQGGIVILGFLFKLIPGASELLQLLNVNIMKPKSTGYFRDMIVNAMNTRKRSKERRNDIIDLMLDCLKEDNSEEKETDDSNQFEKDRKFVHSRKGAKVSEDEVVATALVLLIAGYDTTGMTLTYLAYAMAKNPEIQQKLQEEVDQAFEDTVVHPGVQSSRHRGHSEEGRLHLLLRERTPRGPRALFTPRRVLARALQQRGESCKEPVRIPSLWPGPTILPWDAFCHFGGKSCDPFHLAALLL